jgi:hypothetical protein
VLSALEIKMEINILSPIVLSALEIKMEIKIFISNAESTIGDKNVYLQLCSLHYQAFCSVIIFLLWYSRGIKFAAVGSHIICCPLQII